MGASSLVGVAAITGIGLTGTEATTAAGFFGLIVPVSQSNSYLTGSEDSGLATGGTGLAAGGVLLTGGALG
ncbi:Uncharacterised protein [Candidatus Venteria ishoeyi]|uniref:Uncharacterized protein n=1 Tax=Candidatus Venteria ishoeyi TaxID=1899563 RepID=A0A1H6FBB9_9GAMM|nr:Uncharacterised protein [Candidatus Venteria ishoeyi]